MKDSLTALEPGTIIRLKAVEYALALLSRSSSYSTSEQVLNAAKEFEVYLMGEAGSGKPSDKLSDHPGVTGRRGSA